MIDLVVDDMKASVEKFGHSTVGEARQPEVQCRVGRRLPRKGPPLDNLRWILRVNDALGDLEDRSKTSLSECLVRGDVELELARVARPWLYENVLFDRHLGPLHSREVGVGMLCALPNVVLCTDKAKVSKVVYLVTGQPKILQPSAWVNMVDVRRIPGKLTLKKGAPQQNLWVS